MVKVYLRNTKSIRLEVLQWLINEKGEVVAVCSDKNGEIETYGIGDLIRDVEE